jgi:hypothetical protein
MNKTASSIFAAFLFAPTCAISQDEPRKFTTAIDQGGNVILAPIEDGEERNRMGTAPPYNQGDSIGVLPKWQHVEDPKALESSSFQPYVVTGPDGQKAVILTPQGISPGRWVNPDFTYGLVPADPEVYSAGLSDGAQKQAQEYLRAFAQAAYDEYCGGNLRPSEFTIEVSIGAEFIVNGSAKVSAKFVSAEICGD